MDPSNQNQLYHTSWQSKEMRFEQKNIFNNPMKSNLGYKKKKKKGNGKTFGLIEQSNVWRADLVCDNVSKTNGLSERCDVSNFRVNMSLPISSDLRSPASSDIQGVIKRTHENTSSKPKNGFVTYNVNIRSLKPCSNNRNTRSCNEYVIMCWEDWLSICLRVIYIRPKRPWSIWDKMKTTILAS